MKKKIQFLASALVAGTIISGIMASRLDAADTQGEDVIKDVMKKYHKAPKGTDPVCKRAQEGKATAEELKLLVAGYKSMMATKPPKGDEASWKDKTSKLYAAAQSLQKGDADGVAKFKEAVNCKACHSVHKGD